MNPEFDRRVGQNIRALRICRRLTRDALAKIATGQRHVYADGIYLLKQILHCSYEELFSENK